MKRPAITPTEPRMEWGSWKATNPDYRYSPPCRVTINGKPCVEVDGGALADLLATVEHMGRKK